MNVPVVMFLLAALSGVMMLLTARFDSFSRTPRTRGIDDMRETFTLHDVAGPASALPDPSVFGAPEVEKVPFWDAKDRLRKLSAWWRLDTKLEGVSAIEGYNPFHRKVDLEYCRLLCDSLIGCAVALWSCAAGSPQGWCRLLHPGSSVSEEAEPCTHMYTRAAEGIPSHPREDVRPGLAHLFEPLPVKGQVVVAALRCKQELSWLVPLARKLARHLQLQAQVVVYERCVEPAQQSRVLSGVPLLRQSVHDSTSLHLAFAAHLAVNIRSYVTGAIRYTVFVDADLEPSDVRLAMLPSRWIQWDLIDFARTLLQTAQPVASGWGVHLAKTTASGALLLEMQAQLSRLGNGLVGWGAPAQQDALGWKRCRSSEPKSKASKPKNGTARAAIVTYVSDASFLVSARVLIHSLKQAGCRTEVVVATIEKSLKYAQELAAEFPHVKVALWPYIDPPYGSQAHMRWKDNFSKLNLFNMVQYDILLYVDADIVALQNPESIFSHNAVRYSQLPFLGSPDWGSWSKPPSTKLNGGVLLLRPSSTLFRCMRVTLYNTPPDDWTSIEAEQGFLRYFFGDRATQVPFTYNTQKTIEWAVPEIWDASRVVLLHYVGVKPHKTWSAADFLRNQRDPESREWLQRIDQLDDERPEYANSAKPWRRMFFDLMNFSSRLTIFVLYNSSESLAAVRRRLRREMDQHIYVPMTMTPGPRGSPPDAMVAKLPQFLEDVVYPAQLGVPGSPIVAASSLDDYTKPWVGFSTHEEDKLAASKEGVSLDWAKVDIVMRRPAHTPAPDAKSGAAGDRRILFWYGLYASDYWDLMEFHMPGLRGKIIKTLRRVDFDISHLQMPRDRFWPFGNYLLMPAALLREYAKFALPFIREFQRGYSGMCQSAEGPPPAQRACVSFALERLLHIWAVVTGASLQYLVDNEELRYQAGCRTAPVHCRSRSLGHLGGG